MRPEVESVVLTDHEPALAQMARALQDRRGVEAIHIVAHGQAGEVRFGAGALTLDTLEEHQSRPRPPSGARSASTAICGCGVAIRVQMSGGRLLCRRSAVRRVRRFQPRGTW